MRKDQNPTEPLLIDYKVVCGMLSISHQHFYDLRATGRFPIKPIRLGRSVRYNKDDVKKWIQDGCPVYWKKSK